ncbi:hypothetical protein KR084_009609 [Drosophila pseudotakahashii]|nr:hypothetical protein KR084_009609 [Drosophila pseudotakahashii]
MNQADLSGRLARWAIKLQGYSFSIEHRKGSESIVADTLSRAFESSDEVGELDIELFPEIDLESEAFQSDEYRRLRDSLLRNLHLLNADVERCNRSDQFQTIRSNIGKHLSKAYEKNQRTYDLRSRPRSFEVGQEVIKRNFVLSKAADNFNAKLAPVGIKVRIKRKLGQNIYLVEDLHGKEIGKFHAKDLW